MTPTLIFWIKTGVIALILWAAWSIVNILRKKSRPFHLSTEDWKKLIPEIMFLGMGIFFFFWIGKNFQRQLDTVINEKDKPLEGLYFTNLQTGQPDSLGAYKGNIVILNLWATWCGPCLRELPALEKLDTTYREVVVLALTDEPETVTSQFIKQHPYKVIMGSFTRHALLDSLDSRPVSILLDRNNRVKDVVVGARGYGFFSNWVKAHL